VKPGRQITFVQESHLEYHADRLGDWGRSLQHDIMGEIHGRLVQLTDLVARMSARHGATAVQHKIDEMTDAGLIRSI
jgi:hypothetical protein